MLGNYGSQRGGRGREMHHPQQECAGKEKVGTEGDSDEFTYSHLVRASGITLWT